MAGIIGHALVQTGIDNSQIQTGLNQLKQKISSGIGALKGLFAIGLANEAQKILSPMKEMLLSAAEQQEALKRFQFTYKEQAGNLINWLDAFSERTATDGADVITMFTQASNALRQMGIDEQSIPGMSENILKLAADVKAFNPDVLSINDAVGRLMAGLLGGVKGLRSLGIQLRQTALDAKAAEMGISKETMATEDAARATVALHVILERGGLFFGAADRVMTEYSYKLRQLSYQMSEFKEALGLAIIDGIKPLLDYLVDGIQRMRAFVSANTELMDALGQLAPAIAMIAVGAVTIGLIMTSLGGVITLLATIGLSILYVAETWGLMDLGFEKALGGIYLKGVSLLTWLTFIQDQILSLFKLWGRELGVILLAPFNLLESVVAAIIQTIAGGLYQLFSSLHMEGIATKMSGVMDYMEKTWKGANARIDMQKPYDDYQKETAQQKSNFVESMGEDRRRKAKADKEYADKLKELKDLQNAPTELPELPGWSGEQEKKAPGMVSVGGNLLSEMMGALFATPQTEDQKQTGFLSDIAESVKPLNETLKGITKDAPSLESAGNVYDQAVLNSPGLQTTFEKNLANAESSAASSGKDVDLFQLISIMEKSYEEQKKIADNTKNAAPAYTA